MYLRFYLTSFMMMAERRLWSRRYIVAADFRFAYAMADSMLKADAGAPRAVAKPGRSLIAYRSSIHMPEALLSLPFDAPLFTATAKRLRGADEEILRPYTSIRYFLNFSRRADFHSRKMILQQRGCSQESFSERAFSFDAISLIFTMLLRHSGLAPAIYNRRHRADGDTLIFEAFLTVYLRFASRHAELPGAFSHAPLLLPPKNSYE